MNEWNPLELANNSKTFCVLPWIHQYIGPAGDIKPCCVYKHSSSIGNLKEDTLNEIWNNDSTKQLRLDMLNGVERSECERCNVREDTAITFRTGSNKAYYKKQEVIRDTVTSTLSDGSVPDHKLYYLDVRFNNLCNFRCRTCGPYFSTSLVQDHKKLHSKYIPDNNSGFHYPGKTEEQAFEEIVPHLPYIKEIYFAGGEPMMQKEHYMTLDKLIEVNNSNVHIRYNTNFSKLILGKWNVTEHWKKFSDVVVNASLDASHTRAEYWRKGTVWGEIVANRQLMIKECPHVKFNISCTLSWVNVFNVLDFHKEWVEKKLIGINDIMISDLDNPMYYSLKNIPLWKKEKIELAVNEHISWLKLNGADTRIIGMFESSIKFMYAGDTIPNSWNIDFHRIVSRLDTIRDESFFDTFPEHQDMRDYLDVLGFKFSKGLFPSYDWPAENNI
jgi:radical SAM protein with 4Fe4S-binding SPASM domain